MIKILCIQDIDKFMNLIDHCNGSIYLDITGVGPCDLKKDGLARELLRLLGKNGLKSGLHLSLANKKDIPIFLNYMMGVAQEG